MTSWIICFRSQWYEQSCTASFFLHFNLFVVITNRLVTLLKWGISFVGYNVEHSMHIFQCCNTKRKSRQLKADSSKMNSNQETSNRSLIFQQRQTIEFSIVHSSPRSAIRHPWIHRPSIHPIHPGLIVSRAQHAYNRSLPIITAYRSLEACPRSVPTVQSRSPHTFPRHHRLDRGVRAQQSRTQHVCIYRGEIINIPIHAVVSCVVLAREGWGAKRVGSQSC